MLVPALLLSACAPAPERTPPPEPTWIPMGAARAVERVPAMKADVSGVATDRLFGLARIDGDWHVALAARGEDGVATPIGLYPAWGGPPAYTFDVPTHEAVLVGGEAGPPWLLYADGAGVRAWRAGQPAAALNGGVPTTVNLRYSAWTEATRGPPEGVLAWWTGAGPRDEGERPWWMVGVGGADAGVPVRIGPAEHDHREALEVFRSRAGLAALVEGTTPEGARTLSAVLDGVRTPLPVDPAHGYRGLYTHDGRLIVAEGRAAEEPEGLVVRDSRHGRRVLPVDGVVRREDLALVECGGTSWLVVYTLRPRKATPGRTYQLHRPTPPPDARLLLFDLDAGSDPVELATPTWKRHSTPPLARCGGDEAAVAFTGEYGVDMRVERVVVTGWAW